MYNTVGETAGVTQDVGSDPTVGDSPDSDVCCCCTLCGMELEEEEGLLEGEEHEGEDGGKKVKVTTVFDLSEMSGMENDEDEDEDEEMGGERDTTGNDHDKDMTGH